MSINISSPNHQYYNSFEAKKDNNFPDSRLVQSVNVLPKYSLTDKLAEKDEFRKNSMKEIKKEFSKYKENKFKSVLKFIAATALVLFLTRKIS